MKIQHGDLTVGDVGVDVTATADATLSGNVDFVFIKPSGETITRDADSLSGQTATYATVAGDIDEAGVWYVFLYQADTGYFYIKESGNKFTVRDKPQDMAVG